MITLDYTNLYEGRWCNEVPEEKDCSVSRTVILTKSNTDAKVICEAMTHSQQHMHTSWHPSE